MPILYILLMMRIIDGDDDDGEDKVDDNDDEDKVDDNDATA